MWECVFFVYAWAGPEASCLNRIRSRWQSGRQMMCGTWPLHCTALSSLPLPIHLSTRLLSFALSVLCLCSLITKAAMKSRDFSFLFSSFCAILLWKALFTRSTICYTQGALERHMSYTPQKEASHTCNRRNVFCSLKSFSAANVCSSVLIGYYCFNMFGSL